MLQQLLRVLRRFYAVVVLCVLFVCVFPFASLQTEGVLADLPNGGEGVAASASGAEEAPSLMCFLLMCSVSFPLTFPDDLRFC